MSVANLPKLPGRFFIKKGKEKKVVQKQMTQLRIKAPSMETALVQLSGGNQQKVILGKWLMNEPRILLVDEPTRGSTWGPRRIFIRS